ncbi:recombinase family protein [Lysinibacillus fusiformis]|uniref:recombinase family protein n=1 Tax=Lysinibacillus fusiformis TaxID=28031 RepID=UPI0020C7DC38|nr:recombinase family protein [Lysinibacillus fusiformis]
MANRVNQEGHRGKRGKAFSISTIKTILENPVYVGMIRYDVRRNWTDKRRGDINPNPVLQQGQHEPIISQLDWEKAQHILKERSNKPNRVHGGTFPFTGVMKCPQCGAGMVVMRTVNKLKDGTRKTLEYYACGAWKNKGTAVCRSNSVRADKAESYIFEKLQELATNKQLIKEVAERVNGKRLNQDEQLQQEHQALLKELEHAKRKKDKAMELYEEDIIKKVDLQQRLATVNELIEQLELRLQPIKLQLQSLKVHTIDETTIQEVMANFQKVFKKAITQEQQKHLVTLIIKNITLNDKREVDSIQIQFNNTVLDYLTEQGADRSSADDLSAPFLVLIAI